MHSPESLTASVVKRKLYLHCVELHPSILDIEAAIYYSAA